MKCSSLRLPALLCCMALRRDPYSQGLQILLERFWLSKVNLLRMIIAAVIIISPDRLTISDQVAILCLINNWHQHLFLWEREWTRAYSKIAFLFCPQCDYHLEPSSKFQMWVDFVSWYETLWSKFNSTKWSEIESLIVTISTIPHTGRKIDLSQK